MIFKNVKSTVSWFLEYVLIISTILECNSMVLLGICTESTVDMHIVFTAIIIGIAVLLLALKLTDRNIIKVVVKGFLPILVVMELYATLYYYLGVRSSQYSNVRVDFVEKFLLMLPVYSSLLFIERKEEKSISDRLIYKYANVVSIIAFINLVVYYTSNFHVNELESEKVYLRWYNGGVISRLVNCLNICFLAPGMMAQSFNISVLRDFGPFVEPLMFLIPLGTTLFVELFLRVKKDKWCLWRCLLISTTIFANQSTYGLVMLVIAWGLKLMSMCNAKERIVLIIPTIMVIILGCGYFVTYKLGTFDVALIFERLMSNKHFTDYVYPLKAFLSKPLLAGGYLNDDLTISFFSVEAMKDIGLSNSIAVVLGQGGIILGILCLLPFLIGFLQLFSINNRKYALFMLGPLYLYTVTIFHYRYNLILIFALGYSLLEIERNKGKRITLRLRVIQRESIYPYADSENSFRENIKSFVCSSVWKEPIFIIVSMLLMISFGTGFWDKCFKLLYYYQLTLGQSKVRVMYGVISLIALLTWCRVITKEVTTTKQKVLVILCGALIQIGYAWAYGTIYAYVDTAIQLKFDDRELVRETVMLLCYLAFLAASYKIYTDVYKAFAQKNIKKTLISIRLVFLIGFCLVVGNGILSHKLQHKISLIEAQIEPLRIVSEVKTGKLYTDELPVLYNYVLQSVTYGAIKGEGYRILDNATILEPIEKELPVLFNEGYQAAQISDDHIIYSNDESVISGMEKYGYKFYRYYAFDIEYDLEEAAQLNGLNIIEVEGKKALLVEGEEKSLIYGPYDTLQSGTYTVTFSLKINPQKYREVADDTVIANIRTSHKCGQKIDQQLEVRKSAFDERGYAEMESIFTVSSMEEGYEYLIFGKKDYALMVLEIDVRQTPKLVTHFEYNVHQQPIHEAYYDEDGNALYTDQGYAAIEKQYNSADIITVLKYLDENGNLKCITNGYAEVHYDYNKKMQLISESYYDEKGEPVALPIGIFRIQYGYDELGNRNEYLYCDTDGNLMNQTNGVARIHYTFDEKHRWTRVDYYDSEGEKVLFDNGYSSEGQEYTEGGLISVHRYLGVDGEEVALTDGVAEIHYFYSDDNQLVKLEFYGPYGTRVMTDSGISAIVYERGSASNVLDEKYYDASDKPVSNILGISEIKREYNSWNLLVSEAYYDEAGNETISTGGFSRIVYEYDAEGNTIKTTKYDTSGKVVE